MACRWDNIIAALELYRVGKEPLCGDCHGGTPYDEPFEVKRFPTILLPNRKPYGYILKLPQFGTQFCKK